MRSFYIVLVACIAASQATQLDPCSAGPSFWCSSVQNARTCGALPHCKTQTWANNQLQQDGTEVCLFCKTVLAEVKTMLTSTATQDEIRDFMESACQLIPDTSVAAECKSVIDQYLPEILDLVVAELDPQMVCSLLSLCSAESVDDLHAVQLPTVRIEPLCADCKKLVDDVKALVMSPEHEKQVEALAKTYVCARMGLLESECQQFVHSYLVELQQFLGNQLDSTLWCEVLAVCPANTSAARQQMAALFMQRPVGLEPLCKDCKKLVDDVKALVMSPQYEQQVEALAKTYVCARMGPLESECQQFVHTYLVELQQFLGNQIDSTLVCEVLAVCPADTGAALPQMAALLMQRPVGLEPLCTDCRKLVNDVKALILSSQYEKQVEQLIDDNVCTYLGSLEDECRQLVHTYLTDIQQLLASIIDANMTCQLLGVCACDRDQMAAMLLQRMPSMMGARAGSGELCTLCETVITELKSLVQDKAVQSSVESFIKTEICARLGTMADTCTEYVNSYLPLVFNLLAEELDPKSTCQLLGLCTAEVSAASAIRKYSLVLPQSQLKPAQVTSPVKVSPQCVLCEFIARELDTMLANNATEAEIIAALDKVCSMLPASIASECNDFINTYGKAILNLLVQELDPAQICSALGLCQSSQVKPVLLTVGSDEMCGVCETVFQYVDTLLEDKSTVAEIEAVLAKVCSFLPDTIRGQCNALVKDYGPLIISLLEKEMDPQTICTELGLCGAKAKKITKPVSVASGEVCGLCETVMQVVNSALEDNRTVAAIEKEMDKACMMLPTAERDVCELLVAQYGAQIIQLVAQYADPKEICQSIGLCSMQEETNEIVPVKQPLLGENECTYGPAYWCASKENAARCKAEAHCKKHVWNN